MSMDRRDFLKLASASTLIGLGGLSVVDGLIKDGALASQAHTAPGAAAGKRLAMVIDVSKFKSPDDFKRVSDACHSIHNVPSINDPKREVKWIWTETYEHAFPGQADQYMAESVMHQPFPVLCNHCAKPSCVRVCPTKATFKRKEDGVVMMDYHRCIGCRFCMAACPFGARSFNWTDPRPYIKKLNTSFPTRTKGVVEKCNFCAERLAIGLQPACVEASKGALAFGNLHDPSSEVRKILSTKFAIRRKPDLGTGPSIYYVIGGNDHA